MLNSGRLLALPANIILGLKIMSGTNTLAYHKHLQITDVKIFVTLGQGACVINLFRPSLVFVSKDEGYPRLHSFTRTELDTQHNDTQHDDIQHNK